MESPNTDPKGLIIEAAKRVFFWQKIFNFEPGEHSYKLEPPLDPGITIWDVREGKLTILNGIIGDHLYGDVKVDFGGGPVYVSWITDIEVSGIANETHVIGSNGYIQRIGPKEAVGGLPIELWLRYNNTSEADVKVAVRLEYFTE